MPTKQAVAARPWQAWYRKARWIKRARLHLAEHPLCAMCLSENVVKAAECVDHVLPHRGDPKLFWFGEIRALCTHHHASLKARIESGKPIIRIGVDGYPIDETQELRERWMDGGVIDV